MKTEDVQKPRNLSTYESEECEHGEGVCVYTTLMQSDTLKPQGHSNCLFIMNR